MQQTADFAGYVPPTLKGAMDGYELAPYLEGVAVEHEGIVYIIDIEATEKRQGHFSRFVDSLAPNVAFSAVISPIVDSVLEQRGWRRVELWSYPHDDWSRMYYHPKARIPPMIECFVSTSQTLHNASVCGGLWGKKIIGQIMVTDLINAYYTEELEHSDDWVPCQNCLSLKRLQKVL